MFWGDIEKSTYDELFKVFQLLLKKRFDQKQVINNNLAPKEWAFYLEVAFPMILNKSACLFVVYDCSRVKIRLPVLLLDRVPPFVP